MNDRSPRVHRRTILKAMGIGLSSAVVAGPARAASLLSKGDKLQLARVWAPSLAEQKLLSAFDDTHTVFADGSVEILLWPGDLAELRASGLRHEITIDDVVAHDAALRANAEARPASLEPQPGERTDYRRLADFNTDMATLAQRFPDKARFIELKHVTLEGRTVHGLEIANNVARRDGRPVFYMDGVHHAREWPAAEMPMMWAYDLLESYGTDPRITALMDNARFLVVPVVNPDGFHHSRESLVQVSNTGTLPPGGLEGYWRKNRRSATGITIPIIQKNPDAYGIDNNRNYAHNWGGPGAVAGNTDQTSRGAAAFSEPETRNVAHLLRSYQITGLESSHTSGNLVLRPWGYSYDDPPDDELLRSLGDACGEITGYKSQKSIELYITTGTTVDYGYGSFASLAFSFEHSGDGFHPAYPSAVPQMYAKCRPAFLLLAEAAANPSYHCVIRGRVVKGNGTGVPAEIRLHKEFATPLWPNAGPDYPEVIDTAMVTNPDGTFEYHTNPSTRPHIQFEGGTEAFRLTAAAATGSKSFDVVVARGQRLELGDIKIG
jgi:hypothetical protein